MAEEKGNNEQYRYWSGTPPVASPHPRHLNPKEKTGMDFKYFA
jgi:hypothetical protein